jgi:hypothetical protein
MKLFLLSIIYKNKSFNQNKYLDNYQDLDSLCYETLLPKYLLEDYVHILENHRLVAITNFHKFGKTYLMRKLAQFMSKKYKKILYLINHRS